MRFERPLIGAAALLLVFSLSCGDDNGGGPTGPEVTPPRAPSDVQITQTASSGITLVWHNNASDATSFKIERAVGEPSGFAQADTVPSNLTTYTDTRVTEGLKYYYQVRCAVRSNLSDPSEAVWGVAVTNATPTTPRFP